MNTPKSTLSPLAPGVGPFADPLFLELIHRHWPQGELVITNIESAAFGLERVETGLIGVGHQDLVDYRSPSGEASAALVATMAKSEGLQLDSLPKEAADALSEALDVLDVSHEVRPHTVTAVLDLPRSYEDWLMMLSKKERHETRRKRRRYEAAVGPIVIQSFGLDKIDEFVGLHRQSLSDKGQFMTDPMVEYFADLLRLEGWAIDALTDPDENLVAAGFGFSSDEGRFLYNSAFDRARGDASPGVVLVAALIEDSCLRGHRVFDFLKGDETYKLRLGAVPRQLFEVVTV